ncbi:MAG: hypothetical protein IPH64_09655 [Comamonadaceae bacterium]|nr:hypothetical protein [Comamonadaceae bacterium]
MKLKDGGEIASYPQAGNGRRGRGLLGIFYASLDDRTLGQLIYPSQLRVRANKDIRSGKRGFHGFQKGA